MSSYFLALAADHFHDFIFITAGGFDGSDTDKAFSVSRGRTEDYDLVHGNHEEADTRVWLHAAVSQTDQVIIYSPDTDIFVIGMPITLTLNKSVFIQLKDSPYDCTFLNMNVLTELILNDIQLQNIPQVLDYIQLVYIYSGCDFVSYFRGFGKKTFFDVF